MSATTQSNVCSSIISMAASASSACSVYIRPFVSKVAATASMITGDPTRSTEMFSFVNIDVYISVTSP